MDSVTDRDFENWVKGLETWRETWMAVASQPDQARNLLRDPEVWKAALNTLSPWYHDSQKGWQRIGDWQGAHSSSSQASLSAIRTNWGRAGLESVMNAGSSTEWMALSILDLEEQLGVEVPQEQWQNRVREAFLRDSAALMTRLLTSHPDWSIEKIFTEPRHDPHQTEPKAPLAHKLFGRQYCEASLAVARLRPKTVAAVVNAPDHLGRTPLFSNYSDLERADFLLMHGANPMIRDQDNRLPEEAQMQNAGGGEPAIAFHRLLNKHRSSEDQETAHRQWLAAMATGCSWSLLKSMDLHQEVAALEKVDIKGRKGSLVEYVREFSDNRAIAKELITLLATLAKGSKGEKFLAKSGSVDEGLANLLAVCLSKPEDKFRDRKSLLMENLSGVLKKLQADPARLSEVIHRTFELRSSPYPGEIHLLLGKYGVMGNMDLESVRWDVTRLGSVADGMLDCARYLRPRQEGTDGAKWETVTRWVETWTAGIEDNALKTQWLPAVMVAGIMSLSTERQDVLAQRVAHWMAEGIELPLDTPQGQALMELGKTHLSVAMAKLRELQLDQSLAETAPQERPRVRM